ncbi:hypothetical protein [Streptomyces sp. A0592]|uniref:hypothetical protein n=1 Tax=Streptomyces sp. A0592 TaxID=2563099 RepID=UPI00109ED780|nr:hypothetical protein [Streptomyces sp. A0592]THA82223.1 hypothetical protein E6U81_21130 [Streptomyces sp. A0592]
MITARSSSGVPRIRGHRSPPVLLWLALLLIGLLDAHGIGDRGGVHRTPPASASSVSSAAAVTVSPQALVAGTDGSTHPAEQCMPDRSDRGTAPTNHPQTVAGPATPALRTDGSPTPGTSPQACGTPARPAHAVLRI